MRKKIANKTYFVPMRNNIKKDLSLIDSGVEILDKKPTEIQGEMLVRQRS